jgi:hypothetical protein
MRGRWFGAGLCGFFALIGVGILLFGGSEGRALGAMEVLFFGVGGLALAAPLLSRGDGVELAEVGSEQGFLVPVSRVKQLVFALASAGMTAASVLIALAGTYWIGVPATLVFGFFTVLLFAGLRRRQGLAMTPTRVVVDFNGHAELAWEDVAEVVLRQQFRSRFVGIRATAPNRVQRSGGRFQRLNRNLGTADLIVPADALAGDAEETVRILGHYLKQPRARREIGTADELARMI